MDYYTKWVKVFLIKDIKAEMIAKILVRDNCMIWSTKMITN